MKHLLFCLLMMMFVLEAKAQMFSIVGSSCRNSCDSGAAMDLRFPSNCYFTYSVLLSTYPKTVFSADTLWVGNNALAVTLSQNTITDPLTQTIKKMVGVYANSLPPNEPPQTTKLPPIAYNGEGLLRCTIDGKIQYIIIKLFKPDPIARYLQLPHRPIVK